MNIWHICAWICYADFSEFIFIKWRISILDVAYSMLLGMIFLFSWLLNIFRWQIFPNSAISMNLYEYILIGFFWRYFLHTCLSFLYEAKYSAALFHGLFGQPLALKDRGTECGVRYFYDYLDEPTGTLWWDALVLTSRWHFAYLSIWTICYVWFFWPQSE